MSEQHETTASVDFLNDKPTEIATSLNEIFFSPSITAVKNNQGDDQAVAYIVALVSHLADAAARLAPDGLKAVNDAIDQVAIQVTAGSRLRC